MTNNTNSNIGSGKAKHTSYARWTSIMRKLNNELEKEKLSVKKQFREHEKEVENI